MITEEQKRKNAESVEKMRPQFQSMTRLLRTIMQVMRNMPPSEASVNALREACCTTAETLGMFTATAWLVGLEEPPEVTEAKDTLAEAMGLLEELERRRADADGSHSP